MEITQTNEVLLQPLSPGLRYGDTVLLKWHNPESYVSSQGISSKDLALPLVLKKHISDLKTASFKIVRSGINQNDINHDDHVYHGFEIKLLHIASKKYVTLKKEGAQFGIDVQVKLSDGSEESEVCNFIILKPAKDLEENQRIWKGRRKKVNFQAGLHILTWDIRTKSLTWCQKPTTNNVLQGHDHEDPIVYFTIHSIIPEKINEAIEECLQEFKCSSNPIDKKIDKAENSMTDRAYMGEVLTQVWLKSIKKWMIKLESKIEEDLKNQQEQLEIPTSEYDDMYKLIQNYLREPFCDEDSINLVYKFCELFDTLSLPYYKRLPQLMKLLYKICVGNYKNQEILLKYKVLGKTVGDIMKMNFKDLVQGINGNQNGNQTYWKLKKGGKSIKDAQDLIELKASAVSLLEVLCEEIHRDTEKNVQIICTSIDIIDLHETLFNCYMLRKLDHGIGKLAHDTAIKTYNLVKHMEDFKGIKTVPSKHRLKSGDWNPITEVIDAHYDCAIHKKAWNYCIEWSRSVEILYKNEEGDNRLAKVHFRLHSEDKMTAKEEDTVKHHVNCGTPKNRLTQFVRGMKSIEKKVHPSFFLKLNCCSFRKVFVCSSELLNYFITIWTMIMNVLLIVAWETTDMRLEYIYNSPDAANESMLNSYCVDTVCYDNNVSSSLFTPVDCNRSLCVSEALVPTVPDITNDHWFFTYALRIGGGIHSFLSLFMLISFLVINAPDFQPPRFMKYCYKLRQFLVKKDKPSDHFEEEDPPSYFKMPFHIACVRLGYVVGFLICSGLALKFYGYFYSICLLHIIVENAILQRVLKSITRNVLKLFWLVTLGLVVVYIYSVAAFAYFANEFDDPDSSDVQYCGSLVQCYVTIFHYILIGGNPNLPSDFQDFAIRVIIYEVTFYIIITIVGINIVYAIVVDTFIELREEWWQIERDNKQICFICQKFSSEFEKKGQGFDHHIFNDHYMFDYVYFKLHIDKVDKDKRNAMESYVSKKIEETRTDFFPLNQARCLNSTLTEKKLDEIKKKVEDIKKTVDAMQDSHYSTVSST